ncbi:MAG: MFS transporter [Halioglobus sp.]|nr:MFS transporter [Halioglobus sp.]
MYYGWLIVSGAFIAQFFVMGFFSYGFPLMVMPVEAEFGVSRTEVMYGITWSTGLGLLASPLVGLLADKWSIRGLMVTGAAAFGVGLVLLSKSQNILQFSLLFAVFICLANSLLGPLTGSTVVARWFSVSRGRALGIAAAGTSLGGMVIPYLVDQGITELGWRDMTFYFGMTVLILLLPYLHLIIRNFPAEKGLAGAPNTPAMTAAISSGALMSDEPDMNIKQILTTPAFWLIGLSLGLLFMSQTGVLTNIGAYMQGAGVGEKAKNLIFTLAGMGFLGKLVFGYAADRINLKYGLWAAILLAVTGVSILASEPSYSGMLAAALCLGLATGGMLPVWGAMIAVVFGMKSYGRAMGAMMPVIALLVMPGPILGAKLFDMYGDYNNSLYLFITVLALSFVLLIPLNLKRAE